MKTNTGFYGVFLKFILSSFLFFTAAHGYAQEVRWASGVISFSSQSGEKKSSAQKILGQPDAKADSLGNAWFPNSLGKEEHIIVTFAEPLKAKQILIVESTNPGFIRKVSAFDTEGLEYDVATYSARSSVKGPRLLRINVSDFFINVTKVKLTLVPVRDVSTSIDAIGITDSDKAFVLNKTHGVE